MQHLELSSIGLVELLVVLTQASEARRGRGLLPREGQRGRTCCSSYSPWRPSWCMGLIALSLATPDPFYGQLAGTIFSTWVAALFTVLPSYLIFASVDPDGAEPEPGRSPPPDRVGARLAGLRRHHPPRIPGNPHTSQASSTSWSQPPGPRSPASTISAALRAASRGPVRGGVLLPARLLDHPDADERRPAQGELRPPAAQRGGLSRMGVCRGLDTPEFAFILHRPGIRTCRRPLGIHAPVGRRPRRRSRCSGSSSPPSRSSLASRSRPLPHPTPRPPLSPSGSALRASLPVSGGTPVYTVGETIWAESGYNYSVPALAGVCRAVPMDLVEPSRQSLEPQVVTPIHTFTRADTTASGTSRSRAPKAPSSSRSAS